jgi:hypothetical protein
LNNCVDGTAARVRAVVPLLGVPCEMIECTLRGDEATAGFARSLALRLAGESLSGSDVLMTTDADGQVDPLWLFENLRGFQAGAYAVCGRAEIDPEEALQIPERLHRDDALECRLVALLDEIEWLLDPDPHDPWPRHTQHSGASIAVTASAWRRVGGIPAVPSGEDRAFVAALRLADMRIRHAPEVRVRVSGRISGRARGGMADTIRRRMVLQDEFTDETIEPAADRWRRVALRAQARAAWGGGGVSCHTLAAALDLSACAVDAALSLPYFGQAWAALQRAAVLSPRRVRFVDLSAEIATAELLAARLRARAAAETKAPSSIAA